MGAHGVDVCTGGPERTSVLVGPDRGELPFPPITVCSRTAGVQCRRRRRGNRTDVNHGALALNAFAGGPVAVGTPL